MQGLLHPSSSRDRMASVSSLLKGGIPTLILNLHSPFWPINMLSGINTSSCDPWNEEICSECLQLFPHFMHYSLDGLHRVLLKCEDAFYISTFAFSSCSWNNIKSGSKFIFFNSKFFFIVDSSLLLPCPQTKVILTPKTFSIFLSLFY